MIFTMDFKDDKGNGYKYMNNKDGTVKPGDRQCMIRRDQQRNRVTANEWRPAKEPDDYQFMTMGPAKEPGDHHYTSWGRPTRVTA